MNAVPDTHEQHIARLAQFLRAHAPVTVLGGAGCSTGSGIPDYRDADGSWKGRAPITGPQFLAEASARQRYWARSMAGWPRFGAASPNIAHRALAALEHAGLVAHLITQNVDGLHQRAGSRAVTELHGTLSSASCRDCGTRASRAVIQQRLERLNPGFTPATTVPAPDGDALLQEPVPEDFRVPPCEHCGGVLKPDVVFFGENVDPARVGHCMRQLEGSRGLLCVGTSLAVFSGFRFCRHAAERGLPIAALNRGRTRADPLLALKIDADCGEVLAGVAARLCDARTAGPD